MIMMMMMMMMMTMMTLALCIGGGLAKIFGPRGSFPLEAVPDAREEKNAEKGVFFFGVHGRGTRENEKGGISKRVLAVRLYVGKGIHVQ